MSDIRSPSNPNILIMIHTALCVHVFYSSPAIEIYPRQIFERIPISLVVIFVYELSEIYQHIPSLISFSLVRLNGNASPITIKRRRATWKNESAFSHIEHLQSVSHHMNTVHSLHSIHRTYILFIVDTGSHGKRVKSNRTMYRHIHMIWPVYKRGWLN